MSDKISCRLEADVAKALRELVQSQPGETVSGVVNAALRVWLLDTRHTPDAELGPEVWAAIATINQRLDALEAIRSTSQQQADRPKPRPAAQPTAVAVRALADGLLTDAEVAARLGRNKHGFQNSVRAAGLKDGDTYEGFRIIGKVADPRLGGPPRRVWEPVG